MSTNVIFTFNLNIKILPGMVTLGKFGDDTNSLTTVTTSNKIYIYNLKASENRAVSNSGGQFLNFTHPITGIATARFKNEDSDSLLICTKNQVFVYNVLRNQDIFTREVLDGGNVIEYGMIGAVELVLIGGNCSVQGLDKNGVDVFWVVTGDNVRSLALVDIDNDGDDELIVGSDDYDIRIFKNDDLIHEVTETQIVTHLLNIGEGLFAYALANGTVGMYAKMNRLWRVKSKNQATCLYKYDINGDGDLELITGWQGGKVDGRNIKTGEVLFKDNFEHTIAGICEADSQDSGKNDLIVVSITGEIKGYNPYVPKPVKIKTVELNYEQETVRELLARKKTLLLELKNFESNIKSNKSEPNENQLGAIPFKTKVQTSIGINLGSANQLPHVQVGLSTNNDTIIRTVVVFAEGIFKGETHVEHPKLYAVDNKINISLYPPRDVPIDIHIKALVGYPDSTQFHVFEVTKQLPRFSMYTSMNTPPTKTKSKVMFTLNERIQRVILWVNRNFLLSQPLDINANTELKLYLLSLRNKSEVAILVEQSGKVEIQTDNIALAGDLIQSLASYLNLDHLKSNADFPKEEEKCVELLERLKELEAVKGKLTLDLSDKLSLIRNLLIRTEDARLLKDWTSMKSIYNELDELNKSLQNDHKIRVKNYDDMVNTIKELNGIVQKASRLRFGKYKTDPVPLSKNAIAKNNAKFLIKAIRTGET